MVTDSDQALGHELSYIMNVRHYCSLPVKVFISYAVWQQLHSLKCNLLRFPQYYCRSISGLMRLCIYCQMPLCFGCAVVEIVEVEVARSCLTLCDPMDCSPPTGSSVQGIFQARILEWVAISSSRGSSWFRDGTYISCSSWIARFVTAGPPGKHKLIQKIYAQL